MGEEKRNREQRRQLQDNTRVEEETRIMHTYVDRSEEEAGEHGGIKK